MSESESGGQQGGRFDKFRQRFHRGGRRSEPSTGGEQRTYVPYWESPEVMRDTLTRYVSKNRYAESPLAVGQEVQIPTLTGPVSYTKGETAWRTDRDHDYYDGMLFGDEFMLVRKDPALKPYAVLKDRDSLFNGERDHALRAGNVVLDLGSGEAVGLMEYSLQYPDTVFIGVDQGYQGTQTPFVDRPGIQLVHDDWSRLTSIPDASVDTILSSQGLFRWGTKEDDPKGTEDIVRTLNRITKTNSVIRYNWDAEKLRSHYLAVERALTRHGWNVTTSDITKIALRER